MQPRILIIVLCHNGIALTLECLNSLQRLDYSPYNVLIVDNASTDDTVTCIRAQFPCVQVIENGANLGFAAGNNVGLRYALAHGYDYVLLLNNDTEVAVDFLDRMVQTAEADESIGVTGPTIVYAEQPHIVWSSGGTIDYCRGTSAMLGNGLPIRTQSQVPAVVDFVTGCALLCKCTVLRRAGLLDERFFMYYEETEWCMRARRAGFRIVHVPQSQIAHKIPVDARADQPYVSYYMTRNRLLFLRATGATLRTWFSALILQDLRTCLSLTIRPKWRAKRRHRNAMVRGTFDFFRQQWGQGPF